MRIGVPCLVVVLLAATAWADEAVPTPPQAADEVLAAHASGNTDALKALAERRRPDPWLVADELSARGEHDVAAAFAEATSGPACAKLPAYVAARRGCEPDVARRDVLRSALASHGFRDPAALLRALEGLAADGDDVTSIVLAHVRGVALQEPGRFEPALASLIGAAKRAERVGWTSRAAQAWYSAGDATLRAGDYARGLELWPRTLRLYEILGDRSHAGGALINMGITKRHLGDLRGAEEDTRRGIQEAEAGGNLTFAANGLEGLFGLLQRRSDLDGAEQSLERCLVLRRRLADPNSTAAVLARLGDFVLHLRDDPDHAGPYLQESMELVERHRLRHLEGYVLGSLGDLAAYRGEFDEALRLYERAQRTEEARGNRLGVAHTLVQQANVLSERGETSAAVPLFEQALVIYRELVSRTNVAVTLTQLGSALRSEGNGERALTCLREALAVSESQRDAPNAAAALGNLGSVHKSRGELRDALVCFGRSRDVFAKLGLRLNLAGALANIAGVLLTMGEYERALKHYEKAIEIAEAVPRPASVGRLRVYLSDVHLRLGNLPRALALLDSGGRIAESLGLRDVWSLALQKEAAIHILRGDVGRGVDRMNEALEVARALDDAREVAACLMALGDAWLGVGELTKAEERIDATLALLEPSADRATLANALLRKGRCRAARGDYGEAFALLTRARELAEEAGSSEVQASVLHGIGELQTGLGRRDEGMRALREAQALFEQMGAPANAAMVLESIGTVYFSEGRLHDARRVGEEVLARYESLGVRRGIARALNALGVVFHRQLHFDRALESLTRALGMCEELDLRREIAVAYANIALTLTHLGRYAEASAYQARATTAAEASGSPANAAVAWMVLADLLGRQGRFVEGLDAAARALEIHQQAGARASVVQIEILMVALLGAMGRHADALQRAESAVNTARPLGPTVALADAYRALGRTCGNLSRYDRALSALHDARTVYETLEHEQGMAETRRAIGFLLSRQGRNEEALAELVPLLAEGGPLWPWHRATASRTVGELLIELGREEEARRYLEEALQFGREHGDMRSVGCVEVVYARLHERRGELRDAVEIYQRVVRDARARGDRWAAAGHAHHVARVRLDLGEFVAAAEAADESVRGRLRMAKGLGEVEALGLRDLACGQADLGTLACQGALTAGPEDVSYWLQQAHWFVEAGRALLLADRLVNRPQLLEGRVPAELLAARTSAWFEVRDLSERLVGLGAQRDADPEVLERVSMRLGQSYARHADAVARIQREARRVADVVYPEPVDLPSQQALLAECEALVLYQLARERVLAFVVRQDHAALLDLGAAESLVQDAEALVRVLSVPGSDDAVLGRRLYDALLRPLEDELAGAERILVSPDGVLTFLPFETLLRVDGEQSERAIERWEFAYVPSGTVLGSLLEDAERHARGEGLVALGDPVYPGESKRVEAAGGTIASRAAELRGLASLDRLRHSGEEVRAVGALFPEGKRKLLLREAATVERLRAALGGVEGRLRVLHLGCHGHLDAERPRLTGLVLGGGEVLTLDDVYRLDVPADLVVLSACESGKGKWVRGEGVMGLVRGFFFAGAPRVVVSNWNVNDASTKALMVSFYRHLIEQGRPAGAALREAKLEMLRAGGSRAHPFHWAPFVLWGLAE